jgi:hypothetical protein
MTLELLRSRVKQAEKICNELEYAYEMRLRSYVVTSQECLAFFAEYQLAANHYEALKKRLERRENDMRCYVPDESKLVSFK